MLWRHGQTTFNAERRFQGQSDVPLNATGLEQAAEAAPYLAALRPDAIFSSDLSRAAATAAALARLTGLPVQLDKDLRERRRRLLGRPDFDRDPGAVSRRSTRHWAPPDGEPAEAVADRAEAALRRIADSLPGGGLAVVVGHGGCSGLRRGPAARVSGMSCGRWGRSATAGGRCCRGGWVSGACWSTTPECCQSRCWRPKPCRTPSRFCDAEAERAE